MTDQQTSRTNTEAPRAEWAWLIDNYDEGTAFVTDDPEETQRPIIEGISAEVAQGIVDDHNAVVRALLAAEPSSDAVTAPDEQRDDLLAACAERNIYSRGDLDARAASASVPDVKRLAHAIGDEFDGWAKGSEERVAARVAARYAAETPERKR